MLLERRLTLTPIRTHWARNPRSRGERDVSLNSSLLPISLVSTGGGHFSRRDGMHFEIGKQFSEAEIEGLLKTF
jgi:hypothetical protein